MRILDRILPLTFSRQIGPLPTAKLNDAITILLKNNQLKNARRLFNQNPALRNTISWNKMINGYVQKDQMIHAQKLFDEMPQRDIVSWNTILRGLNKSKNPKAIHKCFLEMRKSGLKPNDYTLSTVISAILDDSEFKVLIPQIHSIAMQLGLNSTAFVGSSLMKGYMILENPVGLGKVFDEILEKNLACWNSLVCGYMELGWMKEASLVFDTMPEKDIVSWTSLVNGYIKNHMINKARSVFNKMSEKNVVSWTVMISGYVQSERFFDALKLFFMMMRSETRPNDFTLSSVLDACAGCLYLLTGQQAHSIVIKFGMPEGVILSTSLVDMYAKCGEIDAAVCVFDSMRKKSLASWNSMIGGYARHGLVARALEEFERMIRIGVKPDEVTFVNVLSACGHGGLVEEGERLFSAMTKKYGIHPGVRHYGCMFDLYSYAGELDKVSELMKATPFEENEVVWGGALHIASSRWLVEASQRNEEWNKVFELRRKIGRKR